MPKVSEITRPYFSHDDDARGDDKIKRLYFSFRKFAKEMTKEELESFVPIGAYGIFWSILEYMHRNNFKRHDIELLADDLRIDEKFIKVILEDFDLFELDDDCYVSQRMVDDINKVAEKAEKKSNAASKRWSLSYLKKYYEEIFGTTPVLGDSEVEIYLKFYNKIEDFKEKLPDILYTLKGLKFKDLPDFNPDINWLLKDNHLPSLLNGEHGKLKSWQAHKNKIKQEQIAAEKIRKGLEVEQDELDKTIAAEEEEINSICNKIDAIKLIAKNVRGCVSGRFILLPRHKTLMEKFDITMSEVKEYRKSINE